MSAKPLEPRQNHGFERFARIIQLSAVVGGTWRKAPNYRLTRDSGISPIGGGNSSVVNGTHIRKLLLDRR